MSPHNIQKESSLEIAPGARGHEESRTLPKPLAYIWARTAEQGLLERRQETEVAPAHKQMHYAKWHYTDWHNAN